MSSTKRKRTDDDSSSTKNKKWKSASGWELNYIGEFLVPIEFILMKQVCTRWRRAIRRQDIQRRITIGLQQQLQDKMYGDWVMAQIQADKMVLTGSGALQVLIGEKWYNSDLDVVWLPATPVLDTSSETLQESSSSNVAAIKDSFESFYSSHKAFELKRRDDDDGLEHGVYDMDHASRFCYKITGGIDVFAAMSPGRGPWTSSMRSGFDLNICKNWLSINGWHVDDPDALCSRTARFNLVECSTHTKRDVKSILCGPGTIIGVVRKMQDESATAQSEFRIKRPKDRIMKYSSRGFSFPQVVSFWCTAREIDWKKELEKEKDLVKALQKRVDKQWTVLQVNNDGPYCWVADVCLGQRGARADFHSVCFVDMPDSCKASVS